MSTQKQSERGQALIFIVLGFVLILGFVGLAIDGGKVYSDRRHAQNSADASTLAGGGAAALKMEDTHVTYLGFSCSSSNVTSAMTAAKNAAIARATSNGFTIDMDVSDGHGVTATCGSDTSQGYLDKYIDVTVKIKTTTQPTFASFLFGKGLESRVEAVTRIRPRMQLALGHAVVALNPAACQGQQNGAKFHGNATVELWGGGVYSNGCMQANGNPSIETHNGTNDYAGEVSGSDKFSPAPNKVNLDMPKDLYFVPPPDCTNRWFSGDEMPTTLTPGLYCVEGDWTIHDDVEGQGVTIYMKDGGIKINGNPYVHLTAPAIAANASPALPGVLIYAPETNHSTIKINGNSTSNWTGVVYTPGADIDMLGTGNVDAYDVQIIGWNVEVGGTADTFVSYCSCMNYTKPTSFDLLK